ncbi:prephenate dehydrogenase [Desulfohalovibrio reitneri]|uniref:prephenate dehydrogenase n=1 Tax=Desulfohalovibrio reitneri TaxID=1307759 RepID=UPI00055001E0|nr:prephenate dehydrogenase [Desulfohalovibrio reitneri]
MSFSKVVIVGAGGEMGSLFASVCREAGQEVRGLEKGFEQDEAEAAFTGADLVLLCVPIGCVEAALSAVIPHLDGSQILADVSSVKENPLRAMLRAYGGPVAGTHPLFGGKLPAPEDRRVAVCTGRGEAAVEVVEDWLESLGFIPFRCTAREHDEAQALVQGLNFVTTVSYLATVANHPGVERFLTPSFGRRVEAARKMLSSDASMFEAMFESNPASQDAVRLFRSFLNVAAGGDVDLLVQRARRWWSRQTDGESHGTDTA